ncbi:hypothetical protein ACEPPN_019468 [Leptodophora sp. 'Broadleaf-Isolate-01']
MAHYKPTQVEVETVARVTVNVLATIGYQSCFVGSMACSRYGLRRVPNDIDIVVLTSEKTAEELKNLLVRTDSRFYLVRSKDPSASYRVLWFNLLNTAGSSYILGRYHACKADILLPGIMNIPPVPQNLVVYIREFPLMPMIPLLLLKLQAWLDHGNATKQHLREKQPVDAQDINQLLILAVARGVKLSAEAWMPESFVEAAKRRVVVYGEKFPGSRCHWRQLGLERNV